MATKIHLLLTAAGTLVCLSLSGCRETPDEVTAAGKHDQEAIARYASVGLLETPEQVAAAGKLDQEAIARYASVGPFEPRKARVITDNDEAFASKLRMVESARSSIDMVYYVYGDDYTSSVFSRALLAAVSRGVDVRLLIDYSTNYGNLDLFTMLEREAGSGPGSLEVRFYNRPTRRIVQDAAYMTLGCSDVSGQGAGECDERKLELIDRAFSGERIGGTAAAEKNISNLNLAGSGLFLSGWYARRPRVMALAVVEGQNIDLDALTDPQGGSGTKLEDLRKLALTYWRSRHGPVFQRAANRLKLALEMVLHGSEIERLKETVSSLLPVKKRQGREGWRDWEFVTDYLHQKLLLVDGEKLQLGGRNVGDSYHMRPNPLLADKHLFSDTDVYVELAEEEGRTFREVYDRLWSFDLMVATTGEIRQHAPNDFIANESVLEAAEAACAGETEEERQKCIDRAFGAGARSAGERMAARREEMLRNAEEYHQLYPEVPPHPPDSPTLEIEGEARLAYLENLPFNKDLAPGDRTRQYGALGLGEAAAGKYLHHLWRLGLMTVCPSATAEAPQRVLILNAYYLPPANLLHAAGKMIDGELDCRHVTVQVLTNSVETTNFGIISLLAHHGLKAFAEFYQQESDPEKRARFEFYEYRKKPKVPHFTLHSKVSILGDHIIIGSANADARSYLMDSNNGLLITGAGAFRERLLETLDRQISDPEILTDLGEYLRSTSRKDMREEHLRVFRGLVDAQLGGRLTEDQKSDLEGLFVRILDGVHDLTEAVLRGDEEAIDRYNRLLKFF